MVGNTSADDGDVVCRTNCLLKN